MSLQPRGDVSVFYIPSHVFFSLLHVGSSLVT